jgi:hypothetical protein
MKRTKPAATGRIVSTLCTGLLVTLTGCIGYGGGPPHGNVYVEPPSTFTYAQSGVVVQPEYVYYPGYQVYYTSNTRQYVYLEGRSWVSRPAPPRVSANVLLASPSVRLGFHDSPAIHHASVVRQYPKNWAPPGSSPNHGQGNRDHEKGNEQEGRR